MPTAAAGRPYNCVRCGETARTPSLTGRIPAYCPDCRPRVPKRGGTGGFDTETLAYRLALSTTALRLGVDGARSALLQADLDGRASIADLRRAIVKALVALDDADADRLRELTAADLLEPPAAVAISLDGEPVGVTHWQQ
jgi:DNA-directed RNA polymerase subunit RPC12/RpoP